MLNAIEVNNKLLLDAWIDETQHAALIIREGVVFDDSEAAFDATEAGDVKLRDSLVWLKGYAKEETENASE